MGEIISRLRRSAGITQTKLAAMMGVNQTAVSQWERDAVRPATDKLPALAAALGCRIDELFADNPAS